MVDKSYKPAFKDETDFMISLFEDLNIRDIRLYEDKSAQELERVFRMLQEEAHSFDKNKAHGDTFVIVIRWIGFGWDKQ